MEGAYQILAGLEIYPDLAADGAIHLTQQSGRHLNERNAAQIGRGDKAGEVADDAAPQCHDKRFSLQPVDSKFVVTNLNCFETFRCLARGHNDLKRLKPRLHQCPGNFVPVTGSDMSIGDDGAAPAQTEAGTMLAQTSEQAGTYYYVVA